jgi:sialic acid synthase SpsE
MRIGRREINARNSPYIIAEIGVNHDGSLDRALQLVDAAAAAGADAVKTQFFVTDLLMSRAAALADYQRHAGESDPFRMLRRLELCAESLCAVSRRAHERSLHSIVTVFSVPLVEAAERIGVDAYKTASPDIIHRPLLSALQQTGKPLIVSTGAATTDEVIRARNWLTGADLLFLQCVSAYPTEPRHAALGAIAALSSELQDLVGYSDHTTLVETGALAVAAGACALEKHLTYDRAAQGPDHSASLDPNQFAEYVRLARAAHEMLGDHAKAVQPVEEDVRRVSRQSIVAARTINAGEVIAPRDFTYKRPGVGIEPWQADRVLGRAAARHIDADTPIRAEDLK